MDNNWSGAVEAFGSAITAAVAIVALRSWKRQERAKIHTAFLDALIESVHTFIAEMAEPITHVQMIKIAMRARETISEGDDRDIGALITYIEEKGSQESRRLFERLNVVQPSVVRLRSLAVKGQVFGFNGYAQCHHAVDQLIFQFDRMNSLAAVLGSGSWAWQNPDVVKHLRVVSSIDAAELQSNLANNDLIIIGFARDAYKRTFG